MRRLAGTIASGIAATLVPPRCAGCEAPGSWLCVECRGGCDAVDARGVGLPARAAGAYAGPLRTAIHRFKYRAEPGLVAELGDLVAGLVAADLARGRRIDVLVAIPLHPQRARERGYDQTALLARRIGVRVGLPVLPVLHRIRRAQPQVELDRVERARNVESAFLGTAESLRGLAVALIDDVVTTGATVRSASRAARACGARSVRAYTVAAEE